MRSSASTADLYGAAAGAFAVTCDPCGSKGTAGVARMQAGERGWRVASGGAASRWRVLATGREMQTAREMTLRRGEVTGEPRRWERAEHRLHRRHRSLARPTVTRANRR